MVPHCYLAGVQNKVINRATECNLFLICRYYLALSNKSFNILSIQKVFFERIGCFSIENEQINSLEHQGSPLGIVKACGSVAWSRGLKVFAVRNGSECLGDKHLPSILPRLNASKGCLGGRGGQNVSDVYRLKSKKAFTLRNMENICPFICLSVGYPLFFSLTRSFRQIHSLVRSFIRSLLIHPSIRPFIHSFFRSSIHQIHSFIHSSNFSFVCMFSCLFVCLFVCLFAIAIFQSVIIIN